MGIHHKDGYSATVEGYLVVNGTRYRVAKTNAQTFVLADPCELPPGASGELLVIVDGSASSDPIDIPAGICHGQRVVPYAITASF
jgi:hypothetical protein